MPSSGFSHNWAKQCRESLLLFTSWWNLHANLQKSPCVSQGAQGAKGGEFFCTSVFLEAGLAKWGRLKRIQKLEWLGKENKQKKALWSKCVVNCAWIIFQMVSLSLTIHWYRTHQKSLCQHPCYCCQVPTFLQNLSFLLPQIFFPTYTIAIIASSTWQSFASSLIDAFSFVLCCFCFFKLVYLLMWSMFTYNLIELHLIPKMLGSQNNKPDQLRSQFVTSVQVIPAKIVLVDCIRTIGLSIKR